MIIKLQRVIHRHGRWIFLFLLAVIIVAFLLWDYAGWSNRMDRAVLNAKVYGQSINHRDLDMAKRLVLMHRDFMGRRNVQLSDREDAMIEKQVLYRMALAEKARQLGIQATDLEVLEAVQQHPFFNRNGQFNKEAYIQFISEALPSRGLSESAYEEMLREDVRLRKLLTLVASTAKVTPQQVRSLARELAETVSAACCRFEASEHANTVRPTDEEVKAYFDAHGAQFRIPEKRKVAYVVFPIEMAKVTVDDRDVEASYEQNKGVFTQTDGKIKPFAEVADRLRAELKRRKALQEAGRRATEFSIKLVPEPNKPTISFDALAKESGLAIKETGFFAANEPIGGITAPAFASAAFRLSEDSNVSDPVEDAAAIYVLHLREGKPGELPPLEAVKSQVRSAWVAEAALKAACDKGEAKRRALEALLKEKKNLENAAASLGLKMQTIKSFKMSDPFPEDFFEGMVRRAAVSLPVGGISEFIKQPGGGFFVVVSARAAGKPEEVAREESQARMILMQSQQGRVIGEFEKAVIDEARVSLRRPIPPPPSSKGDGDETEM